LKAIAGEDRAKLKQEYSIRATALTEFPASQWIVLDYLHLFMFSSATRSYSLEDFERRPRLEWDSTRHAPELTCSGACRLQREPERIARDTRATRNESPLHIDNCPIVLL